jgi:hypothetical protein
MTEEEITGIRSKKTVLIVLEVINDVCRDEFNAQHFFEINGELFCLVVIVPKGNAFFRVSFYINISIKL